MTAAETAAPPACVQLETTVATRAQARGLARHMVAQRLAACAQIAELQSVYRWDGALCSEAEFRISFKTTAACQAALLAAVRAEHPYALPQLLVLEIAHADAAYARWIAASVAAPPPAA